MVSFRFCRDRTSRILTFPFGPRYRAQRRSCPSEQVVLVPGHPPSRTLLERVPRTQGRTDMNIGWIEVGRELQPAPRQQARVPCCCEIRLSLSHINGVCLISPHSLRTSNVTAS